MHYISVEETKVSVIYISQNRRTARLEGTLRIINYNFSAYRKVKLSANNWLCCCSYCVHFAVQAHMHTAKHRAVLFGVHAHLQKTCEVDAEALSGRTALIRKG